jgi:general secretion pathway protein D
MMPGTKTMTHSRPLLQRPHPVLLFLALFAASVFHGAGRQGPIPQGGDAAPIQLDLENDVRDVIDIIAEALQLNYVVDPAVKGTIKIHTNATLRRDDLMPILETILKLNGATMVRTGNFYQIVPAATAPRQPLGVVERSGTAPAGDPMVLEIVRLKYMAATEMSKLLAPYVGDGGSIVIHDTGNVLLISDRALNLKKLLDIVDMADSNALEGERVRFFAVKNSLAKDLADDLKMVFAGYALSEKSTAIRFVPFERSNSILVVTPNSTVFPEVEKWIDRLDQPATSAGIRTFVYKAKHGRAKDLQSVLSQLYSSGLAVSFSSATPGIANAVTPPAAQNSQTPVPAAAQGAAPSGPFAVTGQLTNSEVRIIADEINNALLIQATQQVVADIERTLRELDVQRRQVLIDAQIYEVALDDSTSLGISAELQKRETLSRSTTASFISPSGGGAPSLSVQTFAFVGRARELLLFLNASENRSKVKTISAPSVLVSDNLEASFQVGADIPVPTSSSITPVQAEGTNLFAQTIQFRTTGVILKVKPQVNDGGSVTLEIEQEVSQAAANTTSGIVAPVIGKSSVASTIVVDNGQTIALSGFIRENHDYDQSRVPLLGRVPGVGLLFGNTSKAHTRSELIVLITPHVLGTRNDADAATEELKTKLSNLKELMQQ